MVGFFGVVCKKKISYNSFLVLLIEKFKMGECFFPRIGRQCYDGDEFYPGAALDDASCIRVIASEELCCEGANIPSQPIHFTTQGK